MFSEPKADKIVDDPKVFFKREENTKFSNVFCNNTDIREAIDKLSKNAAAGPDGIPAILIKEAKDELSIPLSIIWQKSLQTGEIPNIFKKAHITPILKPGAPRSHQSTYRPVSLTSHLVKTFERVLKSSLQNFLEVTMAFNENQHGFRSQRSCLSQLPKHYDDIIKAMEEGGNIDKIYLDLTK